MRKLSRSVATVALVSVLAFIGGGAAFAQAPTSTVDPSTFTEISDLSVESAEFYSQLNGQSRRVALETLTLYILDRVQNAGPSTDPAVITQLQSDVSALQTAIAALPSPFDPTTLQSQVDAADVRLTALEGATSSPSTSVTPSTVLVPESGGVISTNPGGTIGTPLNVPGVIDDVYGEVLSNDNDIQVLGNDLTTLGTTVGQNSTTLGSHTALINQNEADITSLESDALATDTRITQVESLNSSQDTRLQALESNAGTPVGLQGIRDSIGITYSGVDQIRDSLELGLFGGFGNPYDFVSLPAVANGLPVGTPSTRIGSIATNTTEESLAFGLVGKVGDTDSVYLVREGLLELPDHGYPLGEVMYLAQGYLQPYSDMLEGEIAQAVLTAITDSLVVVNLDAPAYEIDDLNVALPDRPSSRDNDLIQYSTNGTPSYAGKYTVAGLPDGAPFFYTGNNPRNISAQAGEHYVFQVDAAGFSQFNDLTFNCTSLQPNEFFRVQIVPIDPIEMKVTFVERFAFSAWDGDAASGDSITINEPTTLTIYKVNGDFLLVSAASQSESVQPTATVPSFVQLDPDVATLTHDPANGSNVRYFLQGGSAANVTFDIGNPADIANRDAIIEVRRDDTSNGAQTLTITTIGGLYWQGDLQSSTDPLVDGESARFQCVTPDNVFYFWLQID